MKREIIQLVNKIKNKVIDLEDVDVAHPIIDQIYEDLLELEDMIYDVDESGEDFDESFD